MFEDAQDMYMLYNISSELTCTCDEVHQCQQCYEENKEDVDNTFNIINQKKNKMINKNLKDLEWSDISDIFPNGVYMPNPDDTSTKIDSHSKYDYYKRKTIDRFGNVGVVVDDSAEIYNKVKIISDEFERVTNIYMDSKRRYYSI